MVDKKIKILPEQKIQTVEMDAHGVVETLMTLEEFDNGGSGDYTKEKYNKEDKKLSKSEILDMFKNQ